MKSNLIGNQVPGRQILLILFMQSHGCFLFCEASPSPAFGCEEMKSAPRFLAHAVDKHINILFEEKVRPPSASSFIYESASTVVVSSVHQSSRCWVIHSDSIVVSLRIVLRWADVRWYFIATQVRSNWSRLFFFSSDVDLSCHKQLIKLQLVSFQPFVRIWINFILPVNINQQLLTIHVFCPFSGLVLLLSFCLLLLLAVMTNLRHLSCVKQDFRGAWLDYASWSLRVARARWVLAPASIRKLHFSLKTVQN